MTAAEPIKAPNLAAIEWLDHGFGLRDSVPPEGIRTVKQIHSSRVGDAADEFFVEGDALMSDRPGKLVGVKTADCVPILLVEPSSGVVAAIHAGWRGTAENISASTVHELEGRWHARPEEIVAAIGPSIGVCCYEVGSDVARRFSRWRPELEHNEGHAHLDLRAINEMQLRTVGVQNVWCSTECTFCGTNRFFSFRRERDQAGRMLSFIGLR
jgi:YfiH family protein